MTKPGKMLCVIGILTICEQVMTRRNLAHWGSWDTVYSELIPVLDKYSLEKIWLPFPVVQCI